MGRQNATWTKAKHTIKAGVEFRANRDTTYFGIGINGSYVFGGGTSYAPVAIRSASGAHNIAVGAALARYIKRLLDGQPFFVHGCGRAGQLSARRSDRRRGDFPLRVNFYLQDTWKISNRLVLDYGLRYEVYWPITERAKRTAGLCERPRRSRST